MGNPGKRPLPRAEPQPIGLPQKSDFVTGGAAEAWDEVLAAMPPGFFSTADSPVLTVLCVGLSVHRAALAQIA
jgi:hypothetical protein